ncbi:hypothetical protein TRFO_16005 [Tritrichomonas foetus]|uniref:Nucleotide-diphospho-sugar transferase domain-containing protein n=1 Tax=Tritrichomonas foetus TaxID=1144522 RepID=A0A1J4KR98_9EUKA|nr:hypothetical protein TRFO_16005 [Tritrichomonas foetus]|eukprot:OHT13783.1 hypothetical protein TRFO_16005 [Tritrichomonas foetus]
MNSNQILTKNILIVVRSTTFIFFAIIHITLLHNLRMIDVTRNWPLLNAIQQIFTDNKDFSPKFTIKNEKLMEAFSWINFSYIEQYKFEFLTNFSNCRFCSFTPHNPTDNFRDDSRDVALSFLFGNIAGFLPFVQTLRTTGSKAQIVIFVDDPTYQEIFRKTNSFVFDCGVHLINMDTRSYKYRENLIYYYRYIPPLAFLLSHRIFNRVFVSDLTDAIFQGNPFQMKFPSEKTFIASPEYETDGVGTIHYNDPTINEFQLIQILLENDKFFTPEWYKKEAHYYNGGCFFTTLELAIRHFSNVIGLYDNMTDVQWETLQRLKHRLEEQNYNSYAINRYLIPDKDVQVISDGPHHELFMLWGRYYKRYQRFPDFKYKNDIVLFYHLMNKDGYYCRSIKRVCPPLYSFYPYFRCQ